MFGYKIDLNFNRQGEEHKTLIGGIFSLFINVALIIYFSICIGKLVTGDDNLRLSYVATNDLEEMGPVKYQDTNIKFFAIIRKESNSVNVPYINGSSNFS